MKHGSLFSGIGGFDLAAQWMGWENVFHCEKEPFCQKVLKYYWPDAELFTDITKSDFTKYANTIDILTGGFPCQPYSTAGKRKGKEDERHLWPEMLRAIREIQPRWIVGENVRGLTNWNGGMVFDEVQADLEAEGYEILPFLLPACAVNAPHRRDRIWFVAHTSSARRVQQRIRRTISDGNGNGKNEESKRQQQSFRIGGCDEIGITTNTGLLGQEERQQQPMGPEQLCQNRDAPHSGNEGLQGWQKAGNTANREWEGSSKEQRGGCDERIFRTTWKEFPTQSPLCNGNDGISTRVDTATISKSKWRNESIKAGGNAVVPQVVFEIFKAIKQFETIY